uniref:C-type lectin domain-containing protein n=1 Tax=Meleagris gallopavo TaxID=9103 RepID=A0A803XRE2_MELGA
LLIYSVRILKTLKILRKGCLIIKDFLLWFGVVSCYRMDKESKPWKVAQETCENSSQEAHLLNIGSEEERGFISSYLQTVSHMVMLWTGLNDLKKTCSL